MLFVFVPNKNNGNDCDLCDKKSIDKLQLRFYNQRFFLQARGGWTDRLTFIIYPGLFLGRLFVFEQ